MRIFEGKIRTIGEVFKKAKRQLIGCLSVCKKFVGLPLEDFYLSGEGCMRGIGKDRKPKIKWLAPPQGSYKFNVDGAARAKFGPA